MAHTDKTDTDGCIRFKYLGVSKAWNVSMLWHDNRSRQQASVPNIDLTGYCGYTQPLDASFWHSMKCSGNFPFLHASYQSVCVCVCVWLILYHSTASHKNKWVNQSTIQWLLTTFYILFSLSTHYFWCCRMTQHCRGFDCDSDTKK